MTKQTPVAILLATPHQLFAKDFGIQYLAAQKQGNIYIRTNYHVDKSLKGNIVLALNLSLTTWKSRLGSALMSIN